MAYKNPVPVVVGLLRCGEGVIAVQRAVDPFIGQFALPGGYVDEGESAEGAIAREVYEETGFLFTTPLWTPVTTRITPSNQLLIFLKCDGELDPGLLNTFKPNAETQSIKIVYPMADVLCFSLHQEVFRRTGYWS